MPAWLVSLGAKLVGLDVGAIFASLKPFIPYIAVFALGWFGQGWRLDAKRIEGELAAKDLQIEQAVIRADTASDLAASKDIIIAEYKTLKDASDARVDALEGNMLELALRQPKDTTRIIDNTRSLADEVINDNGDYAWLNEPYPSIMLDRANRNIAASQKYGLPIPAASTNNQNK